MPVADLRQVVAGDSRVFACGSPVLLHERARSWHGAAIAAGVLDPAFGLLLRPEFGALAMSASSITVVSNALLLRRTNRELR